MADPAIVRQIKIEDGPALPVRISTVKPTGTHLAQMIYGFNNLSDERKGVGRSSALPVYLVSAADLSRDAAIVSGEFDEFELPWGLPVYQDESMPVEPGEAMPVYVMNNEWRAEDMSYLIAASDASTKSKAKADTVCDGTNDETDINAALALGGRVLLSEGTFNIASSVLLKTKSMLCGSGNGTQLKATAALNDAVVRLFDKSCELTVLSDFIVNGALATGGDGVKIDNEDYGGGWTFADAQHLLQNVLVKGAKAYGFNFPPGVGYTGRAQTLLGCGAYDCGSDGFYIGTSDTVLTNCVAGVNTGKGFSLYGWGAQVVNCKAYYSGGIGFDVFFKCQLMNCQSQNNHNTAFVLEGDDNSFCNCVADTNGFNPSVCNGFWIAGARNSFYNCLAIETRAGAARFQGYGYVLANGTSYNLIDIRTYNNLWGSSLDNGASNTITRTNHLL
jgi:hypothetical protein